MMTVTHIAFSVPGVYLHPTLLKPFFPLCCPNVLLGLHFFYAVGILKEFLCFSYFLVVNYLSILLSCASHVEVPWNLKAGSLELTALVKSGWKSDWTSFGSTKWQCFLNSPLVLLNIIFHQDLIYT